ncbi:hypothetical protein B0T26DRAFT_671493 [Lasiosphaeria miniovina]|uniref:FAD-binding domain-containing protein n=1 Tax=Lasiosphaeria miniovina TaxID=1954250 RepID=A0AA40E6D6_9PEZI|nr:uncharacterized protein B0T26DRAFT_671493 [Lasiosphaeria miniovina]KAK0726727.1 hypothetical protein B0T26DRAFT_671493 [Lasiosphaeria miniovina]
MFVTVVDGAYGLDVRPRAAHYVPPAVRELRRAGVIEDVLADGFVPKKMFWGKLDGAYPAGLDNSILGDDHPDPEVNWGHCAAGELGQSKARAWVQVSTSAGEIRMEADYTMGCDGANFQIRRSLQGDMTFPGFTWDKQIVATNVYYDFDRYGYEDANFIIHPEHWHMASRITKDGMWGVSYSEQGGLSHEELAARQPMKFETMLPGNPKPQDYVLANFSLYRVHQRLTENMRVGRFLLVADAAHLCNPLEPFQRIRVFGHSNSQ